MWFQAERSLEFNWFPAITTPDDIYALHANAWQLNSRERKGLQRITKVQRCGKGSLIEIYPGHIYEITGQARAGAPGSVYILSEGGRHGCLCVESSIYNDFDTLGFEVGASRDWPGYTELTKDTVDISPVGRWTLEIHDPANGWSQLRSALKAVLGYTPQECSQIRPALPCAIATGNRSDLKEIQQQLEDLRVSAEVRWSNDVDAELDWYFMTE